MKAYIVVDTDLLPDNIPIEDIYVKADLFYVGEELSGFGRYLKPLPIRRGKMTLTERSQNVDMLMVQLQTNSFSDGWNACLDEILGEQNDKSRI